jgi:CO/xanthine dehydrogenase Mo-binding subunit
MSNPFFDEEEEDFAPRKSSRRKGRQEQPPPGPPPAPTGDLWSSYQVNPFWPFRVKVERLLLGWRLDAETIAAVLEEEESRVRDTISAIEASWTELGGGLSPEEKAKERGRMIAELQVIAQQLASLNESSPDYKHLQLKANLMGQIAKLKGLEIDKKEAALESDDKPETLEDAIAGLPAERLEALASRLDQPSTESSS